MAENENSGGISFVTLALLGIAGYFIYENFFATSVAAPVPVSNATNETQVQAIQAAQNAMYEVSASDLQNIIAILESNNWLNSAGQASAGTIGEAYLEAKGVYPPANFYNTDNLAGGSSMLTPGEFANLVNGWVAQQGLSTALTNAQAGVAGLGSIGKMFTYDNTNWSALEVFNHLARN